MMKKVQISYDLFLLLLRFHLLDDISCKMEICDGLNDKLDALTKHEIYTRFKTESDEVEREKARREYLEKSGIPDSFRW